MDRDKFTSVIISPGYGAGWSTWNEPDDAYDIELADLIMEGDMDKAIEYCDNNEKYAGGIEYAEVVAISKGTEFIIREYDGSEWIEYKEKIDWEVA